MKKIVSILVLVIAVTFTTQAQKKRGERGSNLTAEQHTTLAVKKMTLALDLSAKQQREIKPLLMAKMAERKASMEKRKEARKNKERPTAGEMFAMKNKQLDTQIAMKNRMKEILNKDQFEKFEKMQKGRKRMAHNKRKGKKGSKKNKGDKRGERPQQGK
ncbi:hypothetical protein [Polaribacter sp. SA4-12]|uniref:hypothetical protein n=1 Tax=Polaribacter sp. SA4-12 TaxID=1312072 RepID=UPI000B3D34C9|nr:hypothetical protein [Polaribacter sp. SA4-12]ARV16265.1 hypothetical protein BTO07_14425 [Polaribacter sp. SA4-12]